MLEVFTFPLRRHHAVVHFPQLRTRNFPGSSRPGRRPHVLSILIVPTSTPIVMPNSSQVFVLLPFFILFYLVQKLIDYRKVVRTVKCVRRNPMTSCT